MNTKSEGPSIFVPGLDSGFSFLGKNQNLFPDYADQMDLCAIVAASNLDNRRDLYQFITHYRNTKVAQRAIVFKTLPALVDNYAIEGRIPSVNGKYLLSGACALRSLSKLNRSLGEQETIKICTAARQKAMGLLLSEIPSKNLTKKIRKLPFVIEAKNFFNFYHFTTESLIYMQMYRDIEMQGPIKIVTASAADQKSFIAKLVADLYPDLIDRVEFVSGQASYSQAVIPYNSNYLCHLYQDMIDNIKNQAALPITRSADDLGAPTLENYKRIYNNSRDEYLAKHRTSALLRVEATSGPRRIYVGRKPGAGKERDLVGEAELIEMLRDYDFDHVYFEDMSPREQVSLCSQVDVMISAHGAGFANMMYAKKGACFIELSHLQTARHRFGDFNMHAAVSGVKYLHFFTDHSASGELDVPSMETGHAGISLSEDALKRLKGLIAIVTNIPAYRRFRKNLNDAARLGQYQELLEIIDQNPAYLLGCAETCRLAAEARLALGEIETSLVRFKEALGISPYRRDICLRLIDTLTNHGLVSGAVAARDHLLGYHKYAWLRWTQDSIGASAICPIKRNKIEPAQIGSS